MKFEAEILHPAINIVCSCWRKIERIILSLTKTAMKNMNA